MVSINRTWHYDHTYFLCVSEELPKLMDSGWLRRQHASGRNTPRIFKEERLNHNAVQLPPDVPLKERKIDPPVWTLSIPDQHPALTSISAWFWMVLRCKTWPAVFENPSSGGIHYNQANICRCRLTSHIKFRRQTFQLLCFIGGFLSKVFRKLDKLCKLSAQSTYTWALVYSSSHAVFLWSRLA